MKSKFCATSVNLPRTTGTLLLVLTLVALVCDLWAADSTQRHIQFPSGYRGWVHVKSAIIDRDSPIFETEGGLHHVYANKQARAGLESGTFADGSILVYDLLSVSEKGGIGAEGPRRRVDVMTKDSKRYADSGGWGFARFMGDDHNHEVLTADDRKQCFQCRETQREHGFVFSSYRK